MHETLKSGVVLCELANRVSPRIVRKINSSTMPFAQRENIQSFCDAVKTLGVKDINNFAADDLYEAKNMKQVMICILSLGKRCWAIDGYIVRVSCERRPFSAAVRSAACARRDTRRSLRGTT